MPSVSNKFDRMESTVDYAISPENALASLNDFLGSSNSASRVGDERKVVNLIPIKYRRMLSRADVDTIKCENLMYIANFENGEGYAILAGDVRIPNSVIAVIDKGSLSEHAVYSAMDLVEGRKKIFEDYPLSGPGFFTDPKYGDELFINPNTVTFYDCAEQDTLVGNYCLDNIGEEDEFGNLVNQDVQDDSFAQLYTSFLCTFYAEHALTRRMDSAIRDTFDPIGGVATGGGAGRKHTEMEYTDWSVSKQTPNLLDLYRFWHQESPFNDFYPNCRNWIFFGHKRKAKAGCFPLAIAKVLTYYEYPASFSYKGYYVNWSGLKENYKSFQLYGTSAATLLKGISIGCKSKCFYQGTWTSPSNASSFMHFLGFGNVRRLNYKFERVTEMINSGKPMIIYGIPGINIFSAHAWNIDGYKIYERTATKKVYQDAKLIESTTEIQKIDMVHCDFGWRGSCNGYYVSGVFKLNDPNTERDDPFDQGKNEKYNNHLRIITYDI